MDESGVSATVRHVGDEGAERKPWPRYLNAHLGLREYWYPALYSRDLKGKPVQVRMLGEDLVLVRRDGNVHCIQGRCPHRGMPLSEARFEFPRTISCAFHGWTFELATGNLVAALADGPDSAMVGRVQLKTYPAVERQGVVWAFIGEGPPPPLEADMPAEFFDPDVIVFGSPAPALPGNWRMAVEGSLDPSHAFYMHRFSPAMWFQRLPASRGRHYVEYEGRYITYRTEPPTMQADYPGLGRWPQEPWWKRSPRMGFAVYGWLPASVVVYDWPAPGTASYNIHVPVDQGHWRYFHFQTGKARGLKRLWYRLRHALKWGPVIQGLFLDQDKWACRLTTPFYNEHDGWHKERLYRPDVVVTAWRRFAEANARGFNRPDPATRVAGGRLQSEGNNDDETETS